MPENAPESTPAVPAADTAPVAPQPNVVADAVSVAAPALDFLTKQTHVSDIIKDVENVAEKVASLLGGHVDVAAITEHLVAVKTELAQAIGLVVDEVGNLAQKDAPAPSDAETVSTPAEPAKS